jgi:hypothetical protein
VIVHAFEDPGQAAVLATLAAVLDAQGGTVDDAQAAALHAVEPLVRVDRSVTPARADLRAALADERDLVAARVARARTALRGGGGAVTDGLAAALGVADRLFAVGLFFEVHEVLEPVWQRLEGATRPFVQGLIQLAVGLHHLAHARPGSAVTLLGAAREKLSGAPPRSAGVDVAGLLAAIEPWERHARAGLPDWPETLVLPALLAPPH